MKGRSMVRVFEFIILVGCIIAACGFIVKVVKKTNQGEKS